MSSVLRNPFLLFFLAVSSLFLGAAFIYISIKAPFYWGIAFLPGVILLLVFAVTAMLSVATLLRRPVSASRKDRLTVAFLLL